MFLPKSRWPGLAIIISSGKIEQDTEIEEILATLGNRKYKESTASCWNKGNLRNSEHKHVYCISALIFRKHLSHANYVLDEVTFRQLHISLTCYKNNHHRTDEQGVLWYWFHVEAILFVLCEKRRRLRFFWNTH